MIYLVGLALAAFILALTSGFSTLAAPVALMLGLLFGAIAEAVEELKGIREALEEANRSGQGRPPTSERSGTASEQ